MKQIYISTLKSGSAMNMGEQDVQGGISRRRTGLSDNLHVLHILVETVEFNNLYKFAKGETLFFFDLSEKLFLNCAIVTHVWDSFRLITMLLYSKISKSQVIMHKATVVQLCKMHNKVCLLFVFELHKSVKSGSKLLLKLHNQWVDF